MDKEQFSRLNKITQLDYVMMRIEEARSLMAIVYDKCTPNISNDHIKELETICDDLVSFGIATEDGRSEDIFDDLNNALDRLNAIVNIVTQNIAN